jgi:hypothetical protein
MWGASQKGNTGPSFDAFSDNLGLYMTIIDMDSINIAGYIQHTHRHTHMYTHVFLIYIHM